MTSLALWLVGFGGRLSALAVLTANLAVLSRSLGSDGRGQFFLFVTVVLVLAALADFGISQGAVAFAGKHSRQRELHRVLLLLAPLVTLAVAVPALVAIQVTSGAVLSGIPPELAFLAFMVLPLSIYANFWTAMMVGGRRIVEVNLVQLAAAALSLIANVAFVASTGSLASAIAVYVGVLMLQAAAMFTVARRITRSTGQRTQGSIDLARSIVGFGARGYLGALGTMVWARSAVLVLAALHGPTAVGVYAVAQQFAEKTLVPVQAIQDVLYARMAQLGRAEAASVLNRFMRITVAALWPAVVLLVLMTPAIVAVLYSDSSSTATVTLRLLLIGSAVQAIPVTLAPYFLIQLRRPGMLSLMAWANAALNLLFVVMLTPIAAEIGAAAAMLATQVVGTVLIFRLYLRLGGTDFSSALIMRRKDLTLVRQQAFGLMRR